MPDTVTTAPASFSHRDILHMLSGTMLGMFLGALDQTIVATALPAMAGELHGMEYMSWAVSAYLLTSTASTPIYGKLSDLYGRRPLFIAAIGFFLLGSLVCGLSADHDRAHRRPHRAGSRRRRSHLARDDDHRRYRPAARARPLSGLFLDRLDGLDPGRADARRLPRRRAVLALGVLDQSSDRRAGTHHLQFGAEAAAGAWNDEEDRLSRCGADGRRRSSRCCW